MKVPSSTSQEAILRDVVLGPFSRVQMWNSDLKSKSHTPQVLTQIHEYSHDVCRPSPFQSSGPSSAEKLSAHGLLAQRKCSWKLGPLLLFTVFSFKLMKAEQLVTSIEKTEYMSFVGASGVSSYD